MKVCGYCGRENQDTATHCCRCGTDEFRPQVPVSDDWDDQDDSTSSDKFEPRILTEKERQRAFVILQKCRTVEEASLIAEQLKGADIEVFLPDEAAMSTFHDSAGGFVRLLVPTVKYDQAMELLMANRQADEEPETPETESAKINRRLPLSWEMRGLMFMLPIGLCPALLIAGFVCQSYRKKGFTRRAEEAYLALLLGMGFWLLVGLAAALSSQSSGMNGNGGSVSHPSRWPWWTN